jgi:hypothetical protein
LTPELVYVTVRSMKANRGFYDRGEYSGGAIVEMVIWFVPEPVIGSTHLFKYSLFYGYLAIVSLVTIMNAEKVTTGILKGEKKYICFQLLKH